MTGSQATAGLCGGAVRDSSHQTNSEPIRLGPASARRPGPQQGEGFSAHLALWTRRRGGGDEQRGTAWSRGSRAARSMASTATSSRCCSPAPWRSNEAVLKSSVKRRQNRGRRRTGWSRGSRGWTGFFLPRAAPAPGRTAAPAPSTVRAWQPRPAASPAGRAAAWSCGAATSVLPRAASSSLSPSSSFSPSPPLFLRWTGRNSHGAAADPGRC
jgi:hypothetical protein